MILDLREFESFPARTTLRAEPGELQPFSDCIVAVGEVKLDLAIQHSGEEYFCQGEVTAECSIECARCLEEFERRITQSTDFIVCGAEGLIARRKIGYDDEDYVYLGKGGFVADVLEPVRQALILSLPMKPLCRENCRGICPRCGTNLNERKCDCKLDSIDPRWEGLRRLSGRD